MKNKLMFVLFICLLFYPIIAYSQINPTTPFPVKVGLSQPPKDNRGTDVRNVYTFDLDYQGAEFASENQYEIFCYVDERLVKTVKDQPLPFHMTENFKGYPSGEYAVKFVIEDKQDNVLAEKSIVIAVQK